MIQRAISRASTFILNCLRMYGVAHYPAVEPPSAEFQPPMVTQFFLVMFCVHVVCGPHQLKFQVLTDDDIVIEDSDLVNLGFFVVQLLMLAWVLLANLIYRNLTR